MNESRTERHHRRSKSRGGKNNRLNISYLPHIKHVAWHILFGDMDVDSIVEEINKSFIDPDYRLVVKSRNNLQHSQNFFRNGNRYSGLPFAKEVNKDG
ncbi:MAG: hypothetical protein CO183_02270 [Candidatus Zambryskibacteria bacterium CG_4_9_14_3_um_filter_42_9]|uniref:Uncharacterized protein n=1 Tax=Candidatus Zambryskibacteria bacterium CG22_combo_CG10-13_8_21_14_all_42_17 TaxID=1975118 RepID=A0A2H0BEB3_9BACT|nr:MAG: hypothetical protein COX06_00235 [Candidatus Zambryskibacteria bacterium CG22_combo_CG10-13_8_21_14_all_42_17]PJA36622.1 MAG: hypothetical protein CO183_02270 [Candidatus Zambryskibacteria bacterium CG_4_9_14_3_um_filter_42_9]